MARVSEVEGGVSFWETNEKYPAFRKPTFKHVLDRRANLIRSNGHHIVDVPEFLTKKVLLV
jgi:hypothetical protein